MRHLKGAVFCAWMWMMLCGCMWAQSTASMTGTIHDPSGAAIAGTTIVVTNMGTGASRTVSTNDAGDYTVTNLPIGVYRVTAERQGFKKFIRGPITLNVDAVVRVDATLTLGAVSESVVVTSGAPLIDTEQSSLGEVIDNKTTTELPLNGRNFIQLGTLVPGANSDAPADTTLSGRQGGQALSVNGQRADGNNYVLDGLDNNEMNLGLAVLIPSIDAIQEFKVQTSNYSAEYGRAAGAIVEVSTKAGTNDLHGTVYEFVRNQIFDAQNKFATTKDPLHRNQFGFSIGGPVIFPHLYNGHDRTFFFFNSEWVRLRQGSTGHYVVPTAAQRTGDFTGLPTIYDPLNVVAGQRQPFSNNMIPSGRLNGIAQKVLQYYPLPNGSGASNYTVENVSPTNSNQQVVRLDQRISDKDQLFVRLSRFDDSENSVGLSTSGTTIYNYPRGYVIGYTRLISPRIVNDVRIGAQRYRFNDLNDSYGTDYPSKLGLPTFNAESGSLQFPSISLSNISAVSGAFTLPVLRAENTFQYADTLTLNLGRHSITAGGDFRAFQQNNYQPQTLSGSYSFTGVFTGKTGASYTTGLADFLLGLPATQSILDESGYRAQYVRNKQFDLFVQDNYHVLQRLTLNVGLRWERPGNWTDVLNRWGWFDADAGELVYPRHSQMPYTTFPYPARFDDSNAIKRAVNLQFSPRFGFAFRPFNNNGTVVRAAYGLFQVQDIINPVNNAGTAPPFYLRQTVTSGSTTPQLEFGVFPSTTGNALLPTNPSFITIDPRHFRSGYVQQWNAGIEHEFPAGIAGKLSYVGSRSVHLDQRSEINPAWPPGPGSVQARRIYPQFGALLMSNSEAFAAYHALQAEATKQMNHGLEFLASYTYGKGLDDADQWGGLSNENSIAQNPYDFHAEYGRTSTDLRQRLAISAMYQLPHFFRNRWLSTAADGWQLAGMAVFQTGFPFTVTMSSDVANIGQYANSERANQIGDPHLAHPTAARWFNTAAFAAPAAYTFGSAGRNTLDGPGKRSLDLALTKFFPIYREEHLQFRAEYFNLPNHPNLGMPGHSYGSSTFGVIQSADERIGQFALKYIF